MFNTYQNCYTPAKNLDCPRHSRYNYIGTKVLICWFSYAWEIKEVKNFLFILFCAILNLKEEHMDIKVTKEDIALAIIKSNDESANTLVTPNTSFSDAIQMLSTLTLHVLNSYTIAANGGQLPEKPSKEQYNKFIAIKEQVYQAYNEAASSVLQLYAPEFELRPDVTAEAIQRVEEEIINERFNKLNREQRRSKRKVVSEAKKRIKESQAKS